MNLAVIVQMRGETLLALVHCTGVRLSGLAASQLAHLKNTLGEGVARRGGLQRGSEARTMEVRSDRTPQPARQLS